jgi:Transglutaminase-like superfamily
MIRYCIETWRQLLRFEFLVLRSDFANIYHKVRTHPIRYIASSATDIELIGSAFETACIWYPHTILCLQRSAALTCLLRSHGISAQMVIGAQQMPFKGHAWVEVNAKVVNDKPYMAEIYGVLDRF